MAWWQRLWYTWRICWVTHLWLLASVLAAATIGIIVQGQTEAPARVHYRALILLEVVVPIAAMAATTHLLVVDHDAGFNEVLGTYPISKIRLAIERLIVGCITVLMGVAPVVAAFHYRFSLAASAAWSAWVPPTVFLIGIGLLASAITQSWLSGLAVGALYWIWEYTTQGSLTGTLFLFPETLIGKTGRALAVSRVYIAVVGVALIATSIDTYRHQLNPEHRRGKRVRGS